jgi:transposase-like protein
MISVRMKSSGWSGFLMDMGAAPCGYSGLPLHVQKINITSEMMRAYSEDLRERIIEALEAQDGSQAEIAARFAVSLSFVAKLWRRWRTTASCASQPHGGGRQRSLRGAEGLSRRAGPAAGAELGGAV